MKLLFALILSCGMYFLPIPGVHLSQSFADILVGIYTSGLATKITIFLYTIFAACYQLLIAYSFYKLFSFSFLKIILLGVVLIFLFYIGLIVGAYLVGFIGMSIENFFGIRPI